MDRIERDPNLETCPDYGAHEFDIIRTALINAGEMNNEEVIQHLTDASKRTAVWKPGTNNS